MAELVKIIKYSGIYAAGTIINRAASFIMLPIYTRFLTPADYGTLELLNITADIFALIFGVGITSAIFRFYSRYEDQKDRNAVICTSTFLMIGFFFIASALGGIFSGKLSLIIFQSSKYTYYFQLAFIILLFQSFIEIPLIFIKALQRPFLFVGVSTCKLILQLSLNIYFVVIQDMNVLGVLYSNLIGTLVIGGFLLIFTFKQVGLDFRQNLAFSMIRFGSPLIISNLAAFIYTFSDRYFLKAFASITDVGIYSLAYKFGPILWSLVVHPIFSIWDPKRFELVETSNMQKVSYQVFLLLNFFLISVSIFICLFAKDLLRIMSAPQFWDAQKIIPLILLAYIIQAWTAFGNFGILYSGKTKYLALANSVAAGSNIVLNFLLIPWLQGYGAALATIVAFAIRCMIIYYHSQRLFKIEIPWGSCLIMLILSTVIYIINLLLEIDSLTYSLAKSLMLFVCFLILIYFLPVFKKEEKKRALDLVFNKLERWRNLGQ
jgi:O-antigen/teichoic acid export membrane protein